ncbi:MAG: Sec-independent protein translocase subunit TatA [Terracoccus sp.]
MGGLGWPELTVIAVIIIALFGWKKMPDMARSLGRSARVFKSEVDEMKKDGKEPSAASRSTVPGDVVNDGAPYNPTDEARRAADARVAEAEARAAEARAEAAKLRGDSTV